MNEAAPAPQPESEAPKKGLGDRFAETWEELIAMVRGMFREEIQAKRNAAQQRLRELEEEETKD